MQQTYPCRIDITHRGWWVITAQYKASGNLYDFPSSCLLFCFPQEKTEFLKGMGITSIDQLTHIDREWYLRSLDYTPTWG